MILKPALVYSEDYFMDLGGHVFPAEKYRLVFEALKKRGVLRGFEILRPEPASLRMLQLAHTAEYLDALFSLTRNSMTQYSELPLTRPIVEAFVLAVGGTVQAAVEATRRRAAANLGGGFHHAFADHAEGFCYLNDLAVAIRELQSRKLAAKLAVIDCDLHQGNGTAKIFSGDETVFTFSIHQEDNYPPKERSNWDIGLPDFTGDAAYLEHLEKAVPQILDSFKPDLVLYQAGADPFEEDRLGQLSLTKKGLRQRDRFVFAHCKRRDIPVVATLGGGYAERIADTVDIHAATLEELQSSAAVV